jgi:predicted nucleotidyltransferase
MHRVCEECRMKRDEIIRLLKEHEDEIKRFGVKRIGLFGSFSRDEGDENSDVDLIIEFEKGKATFKNFGGLSEYLENLFGRPVDILTPTGIESIRIDEIKESIKRDVMYV